MASSLSTLTSLVELQSILSSVCDCSFLYWHRVMVGVHLGNVYQNKTKVNRMHVSWENTSLHLTKNDNSFAFQYLFSALQDCSDPLKKLSGGNGSHPLCAAFEKEIRDMLADKVLDPLCKDIETDLRLQVGVFHVTNIFVPLIFVALKRYFTFYILFPGALSPQVVARPAEEPFQGWRRSGRPVPISTGVSHSIHGQIHQY
jgi:hypothetical protein